MSPNCNSQGPPPEDGGSAGPAADAPPESFDSATTNTLADDRNPAGRQQRFDVLAGLRSRREHSLRSEGGDPDYPGDRKYQRPSTGLRAAGYRQGFACGGTDALRRVWAYVAAEHRTEVARIAATYRGDQ